MYANGQIVDSQARGHELRFPNPKNPGSVNICIVPSRIPLPTMPAYRHVNYAWDDAKAAPLDPVSLLVYRSNLLGSDQRVTNTGGGNTSSKVPGRDPLTGQQVETLWVKGSGGDLRTSTR